MVTSSASRGIRIGSFDKTTGTATGVAKAFDDEGYRKQTVTIDGRVSGKSSGVFLSGGGRVIVGREGRIEAASGVAIEAAGHTGTARIEPDLHVSFKPEGRSINGAIGNGEIVNRGGQTTITVNGFELADGTAAPNGVWDVQAVANGRAIRLVESYAPRAAVYEALPGFLLRMDRPNRRHSLQFGTDRPFWGRVESGVGRVNPKTSSVGMSYRFKRHMLETGWSTGLIGNLTASLGLRLVSGSSDISAATGGGRMKATGRGIVAGLAWHDDSGFFCRSTLVRDAIRYRFAVGAARQFGADGRFGRGFRSRGRTAIRAGERDRSRSSGLAEPVEGVHQQSRRSGRHPSFARRRIANGARRRGFGSIGN